MRKDFLNITAKIAKKLHMQNVVYSLLRHLPIAQPCIEVPECYLDSVSPEKKNSCIMKNEVAENPHYDVLLIIPIYNAELYLEECIESIIHQKTSYSYKAVFINDGSKDNSLSILQRYSKDPHIEIVTTPNGGPSRARNLALRQIDARYVMFVDSDDRLAVNAIELLVNKADVLNADIVEGNHEYFSDDKLLYVSKHSDEEGNVQLFGALWGKVYKASLWKHVGVPVDYWFEDTVDWLVMYQMTERKATIKDIVYYYRSTPTGFTKGYNQDKRRVETYWITKQLLYDAQKLGLKFTAFSYETYLHQCRLNTSRVAMLGDRKADYALFKAQQDLRDTYFKDFCAQGQKEKRIESALLNDDFKEYLLFCLFLF